MNSSIDIKQLQYAFSRHRGSLAFAIVMALVAYTGWQVSQMTAVQPDQAYIEAQTAQLKTTTLRPNKVTIQKLKELQPAGDTSVPVSIGKQNPFTLN